MSADVDDFLNHRSNKYDGGNLLGTRWHKDGCLDVWFHMAESPRPLWRHGLQRIQTRTDRTTRESTREVWSDTFNCLEPQDVLRDRDRDDETGERAQPFEHCPLCRFTEALRRAVRTARLNWCDPVLEFAGDDPSKNVVVHAGGAFGAFGARDGDAIRRFGIPTNKEVVDALKAAEKDPANWWRSEMSRHKIRPDSAWKENMLAKLSYVFLIVQNDKPAGVQIAIETELLGNKVKAMIRNARKSNDIKGNPFKNPYLIRWEYDGTQPNPQDKYNAVRKEDDEGRYVSPPPAILKLIRDGAPYPSLTATLAPGDITKLRSTLERHATKAAKKVLDWDEIFAVKVQAKAEEEEPERTPEVTTVAKAATVKCEECGAQMRPTDTKCAKCGTEYEVEADDEEEPPPPPPKAKPKAAPPPSVEDDDEEEPPPPPPKAKPKAAPPPPVEDEEEPAQPKAAPKAAGGGAGGRRAPVPPPVADDAADDDDLPFVHQARGI